MLVIVDYGAGNLGAIVNMLKRLGVVAQIATTPETIALADKLILPGVGAFDAGMKHLKELGLISALETQVVQNKKPCLGICLGAQLMMSGSDEGKEAGLAWIPGKAVRFVSTQEGGGLKVPHMGWAEIQSRTASRILAEMPIDPRFYFCHSFYLSPDSPESIVATASYGAPFAAVLEKANLTAVQFHPEKSHKFGLQMLKNFIELY